MLGSTYWAQLHQQALECQQGEQGIATPCLQHKYRNRQSSYIIQGPSVRRQLPETQKGGVNCKLISTSTCEGSSTLIMTTVCFVSPYISNRQHTEEAYMLASDGYVYNQRVCTSIERFCWLSSPRPWCEAVTCMQQHACEVSTVMPGSCQ